MKAECAVVLGGRRRMLRAALASVGGLLIVRHAAAGKDSAAEDRGAHFPFGPVWPARAIPALPVLTHEGGSTDLVALLGGRSTALQLMFTGCSATCPIQGALFAQAQQLAQDPSVRWRGPVQWLSLSIDPLSDGPSQLAAWLRGFRAGPLWRAAAPRIGDVERLVTMLGNGGERRPGGADPHTGQVYIVNRRGELVFRTPSMPQPARILEVLRRIDASG